MSRYQFSKSRKTTQKLYTRFILFYAILVLSACSATQPPKLSPGHIKNKLSTAGEIPKALQHAPFVPIPEPKPKQETYTVVVNNVSVKELLFAVARDAKLNVDIHPAVKGKVTLNAIKQTLQQILSRLVEQVDLRYEIKGKNLIISPDLPYLHTYSIDYVNISRETTGLVSVATEIATAGGSVAGGGGGSSGNKSRTEVNNVSKNNFWSVLVNNIRAIIGVKSIGDGADIKSDPFVIVNEMSGIISVRTTARLHAQLRAFIDRVIANSQRQVLIEATIVEVELNDRYQAGVDWQILTDNAGTGGNGGTFMSSLIGSNLSTPPFLFFQYKETDSSGNSLSAGLRLLETFGDVKVLSSPKIMALNNQSALLKVVDERVYFTVDREIQEATATSPRRETFTSEIHTVPVGLILNVTPQISDTNSVSMNIRPTISRITGFVVDPAPRLAGAAFDNLIPEIQVREMESLLKVNSGQTVVLGGLMQNKINKTNTGVPFLSSVPFIGNLFSYRDNNFTKTELIIFLKPTVIQEASLDGDFRNYREYLPSLTDSARDFGIGQKNRYSKESETPPSNTEKASQ